MKTTSPWLKELTWPKSHRLPVKNARISNPYCTADFACYNKPWDFLSCAGRKSLQVKSLTPKRQMVHRHAYKKILINWKQHFWIVYHQNLHLAYPFLLTLRFHFADNVADRSSGEPYTTNNEFWKKKRSSVQRIHPPCRVDDSILVGIVAFLPIRWW